MFDFQWLYRPGRCNVADPLSRVPMQGACEFVVMAALGAMTRGKAAELSKQATQEAAQEAAMEVDQQAEQLEQNEQSDHDMEPADNIAGASQVMEGLNAEPGHSASTGAGAETAFKERVCAAYRGDPNFATSEFTKQLTFKDGLWFFGQALAVPQVANLRQEWIKEMHDTPLSGHMGVTKTQYAVRRLFLVANCATGCHAVCADLQ